MRILIMGLSGSGKTTLANSIAEYLLENGYSILRLNADEIRSRFDDWDFSKEGRIRQANRMKILADKSREQYIICDFIAPLSEMREIFDPDFIIWMNTIQSSEYIDTDNMFVKPISVNIQLLDFDYSIETICKDLVNKKGA